MDPTTMFPMQYGLYLLAVKDGEKDNACIINTAIQVANDPVRISIAVISSNYTCELLRKTKKFTVSCLDESAPFSLFQHFGMQSGRDVDKFADFDGAARGENGIYHLTEHAAMYLDATVVSEQDLGSHWLFVAEVNDGAKLSSVPSATYAYYHAKIKPAPAPKVESAKKVWVCKICGYVYDEEKEGVAFEDLPEDWVCPLCRHPKSDFELQ